MEVIQSKNPVTNEILGEVPLMSETDVFKAHQKSKEAFKIWSQTSFEERSLIMFKLRLIILENIDAIAKLISQENGKPIIESVSLDILPALDLITYYATHSEKILKRKNIFLGKWSFLGRKSYVEYDPIGIIGIISPWNFPFSIPIGGVVVALMAGNSVLLKPSEITSLTGKKIGELFTQAGLPENVLQIITGKSETGSFVVDVADKILFTGSIPTGKKIMEQASKKLTPVCLELGGKDPFIVLDDADIDLASSACVWGAFSNSGQICASIERVYVHESIVKAFTDAVVLKTKQLKQGDNQLFDTDVGSMTCQNQFDIVSKHVEESLKEGSQLLTENKNSGLFYSPSVLTNVKEDSLLMSCETFGPILPITPFKTEEEVIQKANRLSYALNAYIWTKNKERAQRLARQIQAGTININESVFTFGLPQTPWGGPKESGIGRTHGVEGLLEMVRPTHVHVNSKASKASTFWWYPYSLEKYKMIKALGHLLFSLKLTSRIKAVFTFLWYSLKTKHL